MFSNFVLVRFNDGISVGFFWMEGRTRICSKVINEREHLNLNLNLRKGTHKTDRGF